MALTGDLARLPWLRVGETVVGFLAPPAELAFQQSEGLQLRRFQGQLVQFQLVCRHWQRLAAVLMGQYATRLHTFDFTDDRDQERYSPRLESEEADRIIQLKCVAQYPKTPARPLMVPPSRQPPDRLARIEWHPELSAFPFVVRLDLLGVCLSLIENVLPVAATSCPQVQFLVLPLKQTSWSRGLMTAERHTGHLVAALRAWLASNGGLRGLCIPEWPSAANGQYDELLSAVATNCPLLEYLHGWHKQSPSGLLTARRLGNVRADVWRAFCSKCTRLREFSWLLAPLSNNVVDQFRLTPKPLLRELDIDDTAHTTDPADIASLQLIFPALPALTKLSLWMPNYGKLSAERRPTGSLDALTRMVMHCCPLLESFRCFFPRSLQQSAFVSIDTLVELTSMPTVRRVEVSPGVLSSSGLVRIIQQLALQKKRRSSEIDLMAVGSVHEAIVDLLQYLATEDTALLAPLRVRLAVSAPDGDISDASASMPPEHVMAQVTGIRSRFGAIISHLETTTHPLGGRSDGLLVFSGIELRINA